tara:strand:- start:700 stop:810 length:111 start_codon:yes stop_codon:yes gene_type:complete
VVKVKNLLDYKNRKKKKKLIKEMLKKEKDLIRNKKR